MLKALFTNRLFMGALIFSLIVLMGCGLFYGRRVANQEPIKSYKPVEVEVEREVSVPKPPPPGASPNGHWHGDEWHDAPHETEKLPLVDASEAHNRVAAAQQSGYPPLPPSSVPNDIPEHLKFPDEWKVPYYANFSEGAHPIPQEERESFIDNVIGEIVRDYNPQRPIGDIWDQYIAYEKMYRAYAEQDLHRTPFAEFSSGRADWQYEQTWAFPEIMNIIIGDSSEDEKSLFLDARLIAMGELEPNWNEHIMHDGRAFYLRGDTRYEFKWTTPEGVERTTGFSRTLNPKSVVVIYPDETSDEELKRLGWWNFHINPYTLQPVNYQPYNMRN
ncbi:hypothetical protein C6503_16530 [Candidatus Poribacteria bacterium]|nr:MAG: hypothetical protein C6503_16530 [Candidatus Poribacteria bacterium]